MPRLFACTCQGFVGGPRFGLRSAMLLLAILAAPLGSRAQDEQVVITEGDNWSYFKGTVEPPAGWNTLEFDDGSWETGATPIGYSTDLPYATILSDMQNAYLAVYVRRKFTISSPSSVGALRLRMKYDDGFIAYINGVEVSRQAMPAGAATNTTPATDHETNVAFMDFVLPCAAVEALRGGDNVLAIEGHNVNLPSSDFSLSTELVTLTPVCPTDFTCTYQEAQARVLLRWTKVTGFPYAEYILKRNGELITPPPAKTAVSFIDRAPLAGVNNYELSTVACSGPCPDKLLCSVTIGGGGPTFRRGDPDDSSTANITDAVFILSHLFQGGPSSACPDAEDVDDNGAVQITDAVYLLQALFQGGPQPPVPGRETCGADPSAEDTLAACTYTSC